MKAKVLIVGAVALIGTGVALHVGHEPKCPLQAFRAKKEKEVKIESADKAHLFNDHRKPVH